MGVMENGERVVAAQAMRKFVNGAEAWRGGLWRIHATRSERSGKIGGQRGVFHETQQNHAFQ
jgi:hypothetical protein